MDINPEILYRNSHRNVTQVSMNFKRELHNKINWDARIIGIKGPKGVGKSTLLKQHIKEIFPDDSHVLYVSLDNMWFANNSLADLVEYHYTHGGTHLFLDEVHKYEHWQTYIKNIYDDYPSLHVVFTGSSMLKLNKGEGDLSRRVAMYTMNGLSFREYLMFENVLQFEKLSLDDILSHHVKIATNIVAQIHVLPYLEQYYKHGYYPFYKEDLYTFEAFSNVYLQSDTFHNEFTALPNAETVPFWQGSGTDYSFADTGKISVDKTADNHTQVVTGVIGVMFDGDALGVTNENPRVTSNYNPKAEFWSEWHKTDAGYFNDYNENFVVFFVA